MDIIFTLQQLPQTADAFWKIAGNASVIALHGKMGAGKTTFIHALCDARGVKDVVSSPTFALVNEYVFSENGVQKKIFHIDLYRLRDERGGRAGRDRGLPVQRPYLPRGVAGKIPTLLPDETMHVFIEPIDNETRRLRIGDN